MFGHLSRGMSKRSTLLGIAAVVLGTSMVVPSSIPSAAFESNGLIMYFDFSNVDSTATGATLPDLSGSGRNGTIEGSGPGTLSFDSTNKALVFPGGTNGTAYVRLAGDFSDFSSGVTIEFEGHFGSTLSAWERVFDFGVPGGEEEAFWVGHMDTSGQLAIETWINDVNQGRCHTKPDAGAQTLDTTRTFSKWVITVGSNGTESVCRIYQNGVEVPTSVANATLTATTTPVPTGGSAYPLPSVSNRTDNYLGRSNWVADRDFEGSIRYLRIYNRALTPAEVTGNAVTNYVVTFDSNGGSGSMTPQASSTATALTLNSFTRDGFRFGGWASEEDGSGDTFADRGTFPFTSSTTLYAQWVEAPAEDETQSTPSTRTASSNDDPELVSSNSDPSLAATGPSPVATLTLSALLVGIASILAIVRRRLLQR